MQLSSVSGKRERTVNCVTVTSCSTEWLLHNYLPLTPFSMSISPRNPRQRSFNNYHESHCLNQDWLWRFGFGVCNVRLWRRYIPSLMISQSSCIGKGYGQSEDHPKPIYLIFIIMYNVHLNTSQWVCRVDIQLDWNCFFITLLTSFHQPVFQFAVFLADMFYPCPWFHCV